MCISTFADSGSPQSRYLDHSVLSYHITDLSPHTTYTITVRAIYGNTEGPEISLTQVTGSEQLDLPLGPSEDFDLP